LPLISISITPKSDQTITHLTYKEQQAAIINESSPLPSPTGDTNSKKDELEKNQDNRGNELNVNILEDFAELRYYAQRHAEATSVASSLLLTNKYAPQSSEYVISNVSSVSTIAKWLAAWTPLDDLSDTEDNINDDTDSDDQYVNDDDDEDFEPEPKRKVQSKKGKAKLKRKGKPKDATNKQKHNTQLRANVLLISGPVSSGKTAAIYACTSGMLLILFTYIHLSSQRWDGAYWK
jgi:hypothetical protein